MSYFSFLFPQEVVCRECINGIDVRQRERTTNFNQQGDRRDQGHTEINCQLFP